MSNPPNPVKPQSPSPEPSEPEKERRVLEKAVEKMSDTDIQNRIGLANLRDYLSYRCGLDIDDDGFIVNDEGEYVKPYAYSPDAFRRIESPVENPLEAYFEPEEDSRVIIMDQPRTHFSDLHAITFINGNPHPVRDDAMALSRMLRETGMIFNCVMRWSDWVEKIDERRREQDKEKISCVILNHSEMSDFQLTISCLKCGFSDNPSEWIDTIESPAASNLVCPKCNGKWKDHLEKCQSCDALYWWEEIDKPDGYGEPRCPNCKSGVEKLQRITRYNKLSC